MHPGEASGSFLEARRAHGPTDARGQIRNQTYVKLVVSPTVCATVKTSLNITRLLRVRTLMAGSEKDLKQPYYRPKRNPPNLCRQVILSHLWITTVEHLCLRKPFEGHSKALSKRRSMPWEPEAWAPGRPARPQIPGEDLPVGGMWPESPGHGESYPVWWLLRGVTV